MITSDLCALRNPNYSIYLWVKQEIGFAAIIGAYTVGACVAEGDYVEEGALTYRKSVKPGPRRSIRELRVMCRR